MILRQPALTCLLALLVMLCSACGAASDLPAPTDKPSKQRDLHRGPANALAGETSPYLLQHAHNPVAWYPWGPEALQLARDTDRPIFLSIGYSSCYWCHVMEREVFTNIEIAELMNKWFVNIKVDREERPDLDQIYMTATQIMTRHGGWPNSVFLTPDLKPFFAGTYFPPEDGLGRPGFPRILTSIHEAWSTRRSEVEKQAGRITEMIRRVREGRIAMAVTLDSTIIAGAIKSLRDRYDPDQGGFSGAPKFPPDTVLDLLLAVHASEPDPDILEMITTTLDKMASGGLHDHLGGGFHRYATDHKWRIPHFEKMLYNQALLSPIYLKAFEVTGNPSFAATARDVLAYVSNEMTGSHGGFYTALDAETDAVEGLYSLWPESDLRKRLGSRANLFFEHFGLEPMPEEELGGVIYRIKTDPPSPELKDALADLLSLRATRKRPRLDDKIIAGWNGLMISAFAEAYRVLHEPDYLTRAVAAWNHLRDRQSTDDGRLYRTYRDGVAKGEAYQEDYAFVTRGLLSLHRATGDSTYLQEAVRLQSLGDRLFWDPIGSAYFFTSGSDDLIVRPKDTSDSAIPSGNAEAVHNLLTLAELTGETAYGERAGAILESAGSQMRANSAGHNRMILGLLRYLQTRPSDAVTQESRSVVTVASVITNGDASNTYILSVDAVIRPGWHINANPASDETLIPTELESQSESITLVEVSYPVARDLVTEFASKSIAVYEGTARITATIIIPEEGSIENAFVLRIQACDETRCLLPSEISLDPTWSKEQ